MINRFIYSNKILFNDTFIVKIPVSLIFNFRFLANSTGAIKV